MDFQTKDYKIHKSFKKGSKWLYKLFLLRYTHPCRKAKQVSIIGGENIMKKLAAILATVMVAGTLMVACGNEEAVVEIEETTAVEETTEEAVVEETTVVEEETTEVATEEATTEAATEEVATEEVATEAVETEVATEEATTEEATTEVEAE